MYCGIQLTRQQVPSPVPLVTCKFVFPARATSIVNDR